MPPETRNLNLPCPNDATGDIVIMKVTVTEEQFIRLFVRHEPELRAFALTLMLQQADAEDVVQDACVAMWRRIGTLGDEAAFRSWAYSFVRFTALNHVRKRARSPLMFSGELVEQLATEGEAESDRAEAERRALHDCLHRLPASQLELVQRYYASPKVRMAEIGEALHKPVAGLYKALERIRTALRTCIEESLRQDGFPAND